MKYLRKFNESSNDEDLCQEVEWDDYVKWKDRHTQIDDFEEVFDIFDDKFNLYEDEWTGNGNIYNTFKINNYNKSIRIRLNKLKQDIMIQVYDDEWFGILQFWFDDVEQDGYTDDKVYICDTIDGVKEFLDKF